MRAAAAETYGAPLVVGEQPLPEIGAGDALVRVTASGICATDMKIIEGGLGADPERLPLIPGHEIVGVVESVGEGVSAVAVGDAVAVHPMFSCGTCEFCLAGEEEACPTGLPNFAGIGINGGYAEFVRTRADHLLPLPEGMSPVEVAPLICAGLTVYSGLKTANLGPGQRVAVLGIGGLGHLAIPIAKAMGADVIAVTGSADKAEVARELGAIEVTGGPEAAAALQALGGVHVVLNTADAAEPLQQVMMGMRPQSTVVMTTPSVGDLLPIPTALMMGLQMRVVSSFFGSRQDLRDLLDLAVAHNIRPITEVVALDDVNAAHDRLRANGVRYRSVIGF
ncbi:MAG TPA: alcohol dehydrogenase catalytic domain-containing protein [Dehalococcoidia bacterium]|nr:alcohol dehydrogenase catalytic domain-containing protein [Dehalococcoidia bacterium]